LSKLSDIIISERFVILVILLNALTLFLMGFTEAGTWRRSTSGILSSPAVPFSRSAP
jgi:hypothetical protein